MEKKTLIKLIKERTGGSKWDRAVKEYAIEMIDNIDLNQLDELELIDIKDLAFWVKKTCLNGANNFHELSYGGSYLIYNEDIAERTCTPSELKKAYHDNGFLKEYANKHENWLDVQARALYQAYLLILYTYKYTYFEIRKEGKQC